MWERLPATISISKDSDIFWIKKLDVLEQDKYDKVEQTLFAHVNVNKVLDENFADVNDAMKNSKRRSMGYENENKAQLIKIVADKKAQNISNLATSNWELLIL